jgi:hypothetical protein
MSFVDLGENDSPVASVQMDPRLTIVDADNSFDQLSMMRFAKSSPDLETRLNSELETTGSVEQFTSSRSQPMGTDKADHYVVDVDL